MEVRRSSKENNMDSNKFSYDTYQEPSSCTLAASIDKLPVLILIVITHNCIFFIAVVRPSKEKH